MSASGRSGSAASSWKRKALPRIESGQRGRVAPARAGFRYLLLRECVDAPWSEGPLITGSAELNSTIAVHPR
jgi:hypothetical protein